MMLSESLAQYSALMVMEHTCGCDQMRRFLKYELDQYFGGRGRESLEELPLYRVEDQPCIHYNKGALLFYRLREEMGEAALNRALRKLKQAQAFGHAPYPTPHDLLALIRADATPEQQALITDLSEKIVFCDDRAIAAPATRRSAGKYVVTLTLKVAKSCVDGQGNQIPGKLDDWTDVGAFGKTPGEQRRAGKCCICSVIKSPSRIRSSRWSWMACRSRRAPIRTKS